MTKLKRSSVTNECNGRKGLRCDISMVVVVVRSHQWHGSEVSLALGWILGRDLPPGSWP